METVFAENKTLSLTAGWFLKMDVFCSAWTFSVVRLFVSCFVFFLVFLGMSGRLCAGRLCYRGNACVSLPVCEDDELLIVWPIQTSSSSLLHLSAFPSAHDNKSAPGGIMLAETLDFRESFGSTAVSAAKWRLKHPKAFAIGLQVLTLTRE